MRSEHAVPRAPKSADRIEGAMIAGGAIAESGYGQMMVMQHEVSTESALVSLYMIYQ